MSSELRKRRFGWPSLGVLGGMGVFASLKFTTEFYSYFHDLPDHEKPRLILDINTQIPSRGRHILYGEESPVPDLLKAIDGLRGSGAEVVTVTCNSAASLLSSNKTVSKLNFVNIIEVTAGEIPLSTGIDQSCLVVGGRVVYQTEPYRSFLTRKGFNQVQISTSDQLLIEEHIEEVKQYGFSRKTQESLLLLLSQMKTSYGFNLILLACTELHLVTNKLMGIPVINSRSVLAKYISENYFVR